MNNMSGLYFHSSSFNCFRAKEVDLVPYLTTRLVDDFASHIRLYRRALTKMKEHQTDSKTIVNYPPLENIALQSSICVSVLFG